MSSIHLNSVEEIKQAVNQGKTVYSDTKGYIVINPNKDQWLIKFIHSDYCIGLHHKDGVTLNGNNFWYED